MSDNKTAAFENMIRAYAGQNYAEPQRIMVSSVCYADYTNINDLIEALINFRKKYSDCDIIISEAECGDYSVYQDGFEAYRIESSNEVQKRIAVIKLNIVLIEEQRRNQKRALYEQLKREMGDS